MITCLCRRPYSNTLEKRKSLVLMTFNVNNENNSLPFTSIYVYEYSPGCGTLRLVINIISQDRYYYTTFMKTIGNIT